VNSNALCYRWVRNFQGQAGFFLPWSTEVSPETLSWEVAIEGEPWKTSWICKWSSYISLLMFWLPSVSCMRHTWVWIKECSSEGCHTICTCVIKVHSFIYHSLCSVTAQKHELQNHGQCSD